MKKIYLLLILFSVFSFCQTKKILTLPSLNSISIDSTFQIKPIIFNLKKSYDFIVYNPNLNLQYTYLKFDKKYQANSISQIFRTNPLTRNKIDSFNPSGTDSFGGAIVFGLFNVIFQ